MNQKPLFLAVTLIALLVVGSAFWVKEKRSQFQTELKTTDGQQFSPVIGQDMSHWKTEKTEFFFG